MKSFFRSCKLTADIPTVDRASNRFGSTQAMALNISRDFLGVCHPSLLQKLKSS